MEGGTCECASVLTASSAREYVCRCVCVYVCMCVSCEYIRMCA